MTFTVFTDMGSCSLKLCLSKSQTLIVDLWLPVAANHFQCEYPISEGADGLWPSIDSQIILPLREYTNKAIWVQDGFDEMVWLGQSALCQGCPILLLGGHYPVALTVAPILIIHTWTS